MTRSRLAWLLAGVTALLAVADTLVVSSLRPLLSETTIAFHGWPLINVAACGSAVLGAVVVSRYPRHLIGWLFSGIGTASSVSMFCESYSVWALDGGPGGDTAGEVAAVVAAMTGGPLAMTGLVAAFLLAPDGRLPSRRWRWVVGAALTGLALYSIGLLTVPPENLAGRGDEHDVPGLTQLLIGAGFSITVVTVFAAVAAVFVRLHRSTGEERLQLRCVAAAVVILAVGVVVLAVAQGLNGGKVTWVSALPLQVAYVLLLVCLAVAVLRYRLFDVDVLLNRAFVLGTGTLFAACAYVAVVVVVGEALGEWAGSYVLSVAATVVVALAFQPLRRRLVRLADRLAYGPRAVPYDALAAFSRSIGSSPAPETLLPAVAEAAATSVSARAAAVTVDVAAGASPARRLAPGAGVAADWGPGRCRGGVPVTTVPASRAVAVSLAPGHTLRPRSAAARRHR
jgi:hypothetical protein